MNTQRLPHRLRLAFALLLAASLALDPLARAGTPEAVDTTTMGLLAPVADTQVAPAPPVPAATGPQPKQSDQVGLCEGVEGDPDSMIGKGAVIQRWPPSDPPTAEYQKAVLSWSDRNRKVIQESTGIVHKKYQVGNPGSAPTGTPDPAKASPELAGTPDLSSSVIARAKFFDLSYGQRSAIFEICESKRRLAQHLKSYEDSKRKFDEQAGKLVEACGSSMKGMRESYERASSTYRRLQQVIVKRLDGQDPVTKEKAISLKVSFREHRQANYTNLQYWKTVLKTKSPADWAALEREYDILWGRGALAAGPADAAKIQPGGFYSDFLLQTMQEKTNSEQKQYLLNTQAASLREREANCKGIVTTIADSTITGNPNGADDGGTGGSRPPPGDGGITTKPPGDGTPTGQTGNEVPDPQNTGNNGPGVTTTDNTQTTDEDLNQDEDRPQKKEKGGTSGFLKDNWMWLAGGAAVVGGGIYLYKKDKKKKKNERYWQDDSNFGPTSTGTSTTTVTQTVNVNPGGNVPAGSRLIIVQPINGATVGQTMEAIELAIVNANGTLQTLDGIAVEASCLTPNPCSLTGAKSVTTTGGKVFFTGLKFNQADRGVKLQFSGPGLPSTSMPNTFDVQGENRE